jgi:hypothetical protein
LTPDTAAENPATFQRGFEFSDGPHDRTMRGSIFRSLAWINRAVLPKMWHRDLQRLRPWQKAIIAWRYWVTRNALR